MSEGAAAAGLVMSGSSDQQQKHEEREREQSPTKTAAAQGATAVKATSRSGGRSPENQIQKHGRTRQRQRQRRCGIFGLACALVCSRCLRNIMIVWPVKTTSNDSIIESASLLGEIQEKSSSQQQQHNNSDNNDEEEKCGTGDSIKTTTRRNIKIPFNVRTDLKLRPFVAVESEKNSTSSSDDNPQARQQQLPRTTHRCVQARGGWFRKGRRRRRRVDYYPASEWQRRTCLYENLYFHPATETFYYYYYYYHDDDNNDNNDSNDDNSNSGNTNKRNEKKTKKKKKDVNKIYGDYYGRDRGIRTASGYLVAERHVTHPITHVGRFHRFVPMLTDGDGDDNDDDGQQPPVLAPGLVVPLQLLQKNGTSTIKIRPNVVAVVEEPTPADTDPVFVLYKPSYDFNFGHFLIDDVYSVFTMLDFFGYTTTTTALAMARTTPKNRPRCRDGEPSSRRNHQHIPVHLEQHHGDIPDPFYRCRKDNAESGRWYMCAKMLKRVMAGLLGIRPDIRNVTTATTSNSSSSVAPDGQQRQHAQQQSSVSEDVDIARTSNFFGPHIARDSTSTSTSATQPKPHQYLVSLPAGTELVLLPAVIAGPGHLAAASCAGECVLHRASQMERFRNWMFHNVFKGNKKASLSLGNKRTVRTTSILGQSSLAPPSVTASSSNLIPATTAHNSSGEETAGVSGQHDDDILITVSLAVGNSHGPEYICPFEEAIVPALEGHFRHHHRVKLIVVDMSSLTLQKQVDVVASSRVFITNQGGGAATILFLRKGATAVLFYNSTTQDKKFFIESNLYGAAGGYINVEWVDKNDYCLNNGDNNDRSDAAVRDFVLLVEDLIHSNHQIQQIIQQQQRQRQTTTAATHNKNGESST